MNNPSVNYKQYGEQSKISIREADPVVSCLSSSKFNVDTTNPLRFQVDRCNNWMSQRCSKKWDKYCDLYLADKKNSDFTGKATNEWLRKALEEKFCRVDTSIPGSYCYEKCDLFDPLAPGGAEVCHTQGDIVYRDSNKLYNLDTNYNWSGKLTTPSVIKFTGCKKTCDLVDSYKFEEDDFILNECLDRGIGQDILQNVAENIVSKNIVVNNSRMKLYISRYVIGSDRTNLTPGFSSLGRVNVVTNQTNAIPAVNPYLPPNSSISVGNIGNFGNSPPSNVVPVYQVPKIPAQPQPQPQSDTLIQPVTTTSTLSIPPESEEFRYLNHNMVVKLSTKKLLLITIILLLLVLLSLNK